VCAPSKPPHAPPTPPTPTPSQPAETSPGDSDPRWAFLDGVNAPALQDGIAVFFSPGGHCTEAIVSRIGEAKKSIRVLAYRLTSPEIDGALLAAHKRGVAVSIVLDGAQQTMHYSDATFFSNAGMSVLIDGMHAIAHNKVIVIDDADVLTGSFNFTVAAEKSNAENLLVIHGKPVLAKAYLEDFERHAGHAKPYVSPTDREEGQK